MMLPPSCKVVLINPRTTVTIANRGWTVTDLKHSLVLSKLSHVIIMYQYSGSGSNGNYYYIATRIKINSNIQKNTTYVAAFSTYNGNFWIVAGIT